MYRIKQTIRRSFILLFGYGRDQQITYSQMQISVFGDKGNMISQWADCCFKTYTEGNMIRDAGNLFEYFTTRKENATLLR